MSVNHSWDAHNLPIKYNPLILNSVCIENDVWIGCGCIVLAGVTIHQRAVVAAGAVVTRDVHSNVVVAGVPAKQIKVI